MNELERNVKVTLQFFFSCTIWNRRYSGGSRGCSRTSKFMLFYFLSLVCLSFFCWMVYKIFILFNFLDHLSFLIFIAWRYHINCLYSNSFYSIHSGISYMHCVLLECSNHHFYFTKVSHSQERKLSINPYKRCPNMHMNSI